jgi:hypothetical protein
VADLHVQGLPTRHAHGLEDFDVAPGAWVPVAIRHHGLNHSTRRTAGLSRPDVIPERPAPKSLNQPDTINRSLRVDMRSVNTQPPLTFSSWGAAGA